MTQSMFIPNSFQTPNAYADELMPYLTPEEWKVLSFASRKIFGFQKRQDRISKNQFMEGTGMGEAAVSSAIENLHRFGILIIADKNDSTKNQGRLFALQLDDALVDMDGLKNRMDGKKTKDSERMRKARSAREITPPIIQYTQAYPIDPPLSDNTTPILSDNTTPPLLDKAHNNHIKNNLNTESADKPARPKRHKKQVDERSSHPAIVCVRGITGRYPSKANYDQVIEILTESPDAEKAAECFKWWTFGGRNPAGLGWLDWYKNGIPEFARKGPVRARAADQPAASNTRVQPGAARQDGDGKRIYL